MFKRFLVASFSYFSLLVVLLSLLKVNVAMAETKNEAALKSFLRNYHYHQKSIQQQASLLDFSELLLLIEDGEELDETSDNNDQNEPFSFSFLPLSTNAICECLSKVETRKCTKNSATQAIQFCYPPVYIQFCNFRL